MPHSKRSTTQKTRQNIRAKEKAANDNFWDRCRARFFPSFLQGLTWRRVWLSSLILFAFGWGGMIVIAGELHKKSFAQIEDKAIEVTASHGYVVKDIILEGRYYTSKAWLQETLSSINGAPLFGINPSSLSDKLIKNPWIKAAQVKRIWPDKVKISLWEREPSFIKITPTSAENNASRFTLIDKDGAAIIHVNRDEFPSLPIIRGKAAENYAGKLIPMIQAEPNIYQKMAYIDFISERRWDLILTNGITIKLPEKDIGLALRKLSIAAEQQDLLSRPLDAIDMRDQNRIVLDMKKGKKAEFELTGNGEAL